MRFRAATVDDTEAIVALQCSRNGADCDAPVRRLLARDDVGPRRFAVATDDDGSVVASLCLIPERLRIGEVALETGQVEFVATARGYERQGLIRSLMDLAHGWSSDDGQLVQIIAGIPYFYRRFGYEYAIPFHRVWYVDDAPDGLGSGWSVRSAAAADAERFVALQLAALDDVPLSLVPRPVTAWEERLVADGEPRWVVAEHAGAVRAVASLGPPPPGFGEATMVGAVAFGAGDRAAALDALLATAAEAGGAVAVQERRHVDDLLRGRGRLHPRQYALYVRVPDVVRLLDHLRSVLTERLRRSGRGDVDDDLLVSFYRDAVRMRIEAGTVTDVHAVPGEQDPADAGGMGIPPDLVATLVFGKSGAAGLAAGHEDVLLGTRRELAEVLFPRLERDIALL